MITESLSKVSYSVQVDGTVAEVVQLLTKQLGAKRFGILSNIDVQKTIKEKLGQDVGPSVILDVCNPGNAKKALDAHKEVLLALPCKIVVYESNGKVVASLYKPTESIKELGFYDLSSLAKEVEDDLKAVIDSLLDE